MQWLYYIINVESAFWVLIMLYYMWNLSTCGFRGCYASFVFVVNCIVFHACSFTPQDILYVDKSIAVLFTIVNIRFRYTSCTSANSRWVLPTHCTHVSTRTIQSRYTMQKVILLHKCCGYYTWKESIVTSTPRKDKCLSLSAHMQGYGTWFVCVSICLLPL